MFKFLEPGYYDEMEADKTLGIATLACMALVELIQLYSYATTDIFAYFVLHALSALTLTSILYSVLMMMGRPARQFVLTWFLFHQLALLPDILVNFGVTRGNWMNVFFAHFYLEERGGGMWTMLAAGVVTTALYLVLKKTLKKQ